MKLSVYLRTIAIALVCFCTLSVQGQYKQSVSILGDSYSTYEGYLQPDTNTVWYHAIPIAGRTDVSHVRQTWWHRFISEGGYKLCVNNSFSGSTICHSGYKRGTPDYADYSDRSFVTRMTNLGNPDIILVFGGTNDSWAGSPIGEYQYASWTKDDLYAFRPAMAYLLDGLKDHYPNVEIYFMLNDGLSDEVNTSVRVICQHYDIPCIELHDIDKMSNHPSVKGMEAIAHQVTDFMQSNP